MPLLFISMLIYKFSQDKAHLSASVKNERNKKTSYNTLTFIKINCNFIRLELLLRDYFGPSQKSYH